MEQKEENNLSDKEDESDFSSLNKYFIDDDLIKKIEPARVKTVTENVSINESQFRFFEKEEEIETQVINSEVEKDLSKDSKKVLIKREFFESLEDDSLTLNTYANVNRDWNRK